MEPSASSSLHSKLEKMNLEFEEHCLVLQGGEAIDDVINSCLSLRSQEKNPDDAFHVMDMGYVVRMIDQWKRLLPRVYPFYAVKANFDPMLLRIMAQMKLGFDCASMGEIKMVTTLGVHPSKIVYANPNKQLSHLKYASSISVDLTVFDNEEELYKIKKHAPHMRLLLRLSTKVFGNSRHEVWHDQYGCSRERATSLLKLAKKLDLNVHGVCFHVGIAIASVDAHVRAIKLSRIVFDEATEMGFQMKLLDIGGGFTCKTTNDYCKIDFTQMASMIQQTLDEEFPVDSGVDIIAEPCTYLTMPSGTLVVNIIGKKCLVTDADFNSKRSAPEFQYFINDGVYSSLRHFVEVEQDLVIKPVSKTRRSEPLKKCTIYGQTLAPDLVMKECQLPEMMVGEWLYITDIGAYGSVLCTSFNGFQPRPVIRFITQSDKTVITDPLYICRIHAVPDSRHAAMMRGWPDDLGVNIGQSQSTHSAITVLDDNQIDADLSHRKRLNEITAEVDYLEEEGTLPESHPRTEEENSFDW